MVGALWVNPAVQGLLRGERGERGWRDAPDSDVGVWGSESQGLCVSLSLCATQMLALCLFKSVLRRLCNENNPSVRSVLDFPVKTEPPPPHRTPECWSTGRHTLHTCRWPVPWSVCTHEAALSNRPRVQHTSQGRNWVCNSGQQAATQPPTPAPAGATGDFGPRDRAEGESQKLRFSFRPRLLFFLFLSFPKSRLLLGRAGSGPD